MTPAVDQHEPGHPLCTPLFHCHSHHVDEAEDRVFVSCGECGHVYRYAGSMWWAYLRESFKLFCQEMREPLRPPTLPTWEPDAVQAEVGNLVLLPAPEGAYHWSLRWPRAFALVQMARAPFTRPSQITFCQECIHDL